MRHQVAGRHLNRDTNARKGLFKALMLALVERGEMVTTLPKAKELKRIADQLIHQAQTDTLTSRRELHQFFGRRDVVNTLVDRIAPAMSDRTSGFTRMSRVGRRRGDNVEMVKVSLVTLPEVIGTFKSGKVFEAKPKAAPKAKVAKPKAEAKPKAAVAKKVAAKPTAKKAVKK